MSETKEIQRFHREYDQAAKTLVHLYNDGKDGRNLGVEEQLLQLAYLDSLYRHIDRANDEHVMTVLEEVEP